MIDTSSSPVFYLPGAGGGAPDLTLLRSGPADMTQFEKVPYPDGPRYLTDGFTVDSLISELAAQIEARAPCGPIRLMGMSIGGHLGYAVALHLEAKGREVTGLCVIDAFLFDSAGPSEGWKGRALAGVLELIRKRRFKELADVLQAGCWRALIRFAQARFPSLLSCFASASRPAADPAAGSVLQQELAMRLLISKVADWIPAMDRTYAPFKGPSVLIRTKQIARDDESWRRRCPNIDIYEAPGTHHTLFEPENVGSLRQIFASATRQWC